jgi:hypothetical protein
VEYEERKVDGVDLVDRSGTSCGGVERVMVEIVPVERVDG